MTACNGSWTRPSEASGPAGGDAGLCEELCGMQADLLGMGDDNYARLCRVCPDSDLRLHALLHRVANRDRPACRPTLRVHGQRPRPREAASLPSVTHLRFQRNGQRWYEVNGHAASAFDLDEAWDAAEYFTSAPHRDAHRCWRCDARSAADDIGLCPPCHGSLVSH